MNSEDMKDLKEIFGNFASKDDLKDALESKGAKNPDRDADILQHLKECNDPECELTKYKNELEEDSLAIGMLMSDLI